MADNSLIAEIEFMSLVLLKVAEERKCLVLENAKTTMYIS